MANRFMCETLGSACLGLSMALAAPAAFALTDIIETPALMSDLAPESLLNDATRAGDRIVAVGERGHVIYSDDEGQTWTQAEVPVSVTLNAVDFGSDSSGWVVGHSGVVLHSGDAGAVHLYAKTALEREPLVLLRLARHGRLPLVVRLHGRLDDAVAH